MHNIYNNYFKGSVINFVILDALNVSDNKQLKLIYTNIPFFIDISNIIYTTYLIYRRNELNKSKEYQILNIDVIK